MASLVDETRYVKPTEPAWFAERLPPTLGRDFERMAEYARLADEAQIAFRSELAGLLIEMQELNGHRGIWSAALVARARGIGHAVGVVLEQVERLKGVDLRDRLAALNGG